MIYFDNSATSPVFDESLDSYVQVSKTYFANPSSLHQLGVQAHKLLDSAREQIAGILQVDAEEIIFTSSGSESNNQAIKGTCLQKAKFGNHIITTQVEHPSVREPFKVMAEQGFDVTYLSVDDQGQISLEELRESLRPDTILVSIIAVNNEVGMFQPLDEISEILKNYPKVNFHVDAVQAVGKLNPLVSNDRIDLLTVSGHKFNAPRGISFLYKKHSCQIRPLIDGGGHERGLRSSTENVAGAVALAKSLRMTYEQAEEVNERHRQINQYLRQELGQINKVEVFSPEDASPHILCFAMPGIRGETMVHALETEDIYVSTTSACSSQVADVPSTLTAMGVPQEVAQCANRISLGYQNTLAEAEKFVKVYKQLAKKFEKII